MSPFQCLRCHDCCKQPGFVYLNEEDVEKFAARMNLSVYDFTEHYCLLLDRKHLVLKKNPDETCLFLGPEGCTVYTARPRQCRDFPIFWKTERSLSYCKGMQRKN